MIFNSTDANDWFNRNRTALEEKNCSNITNALIESIELIGSEFDSVLEIGCSSGARVAAISEHLGAVGCGIDPSDEAVAYGRKAFPNLDLQLGFSYNLPYEDSRFDLVVLGFFLYLVDREMYLRTISEVDRVVKSGGFLAIIDFDSPVPYANTFSHNQKLLSYKTNNARVFEASCLYSIVSKVPIVGKTVSFSQEIDERVSIQLLYKEPNLFCRSSEPVK